MRLAPPPTEFAYLGQQATDGGAAWTHVGAAGAGASLNLTGVTAAMNSTQYRVAVRTKLGSEPFIRYLSPTATPTVLPVT
jgi:hypothetical protein